MKTKIILMFAVLGYLTTCYGQQDTSWGAWSRLIGNWTGEGNGKPGTGGGFFSFSTDLDNNILVRKSHSEYPAAENKPKIIHDDLMIIYKDFAGKASKAIYFDNEGHTINYNITYTDSSIILTGEKVKNTPVFRLSYIWLHENSINVKFEFSKDGENFSTYIEGKAIKEK